MVFYVEPISHICTIAVDRQRLSREAPNDYVWDELFGKVIRTVVVRAIGDEGGQPVSLAPGADQVI